MGAVGGGSRRGRGLQAGDIEAAMCLESVQSALSVPSKPACPSSVPSPAALTFTTCPASLPLPSRRSCPQPSSARQRHAAA